ncbi:MAG: 30S ribosomal protein S18 [Patescibacteria group bacterium]|jgi:small subunit ribosomal protein S18
MNNKSNKKRSYSPEPATTVKKQCYFCANAYEEIDYKDATLLRRFTSSYGKIAPRRRSGVCALHQRQLAEGIKRARVMALLPFVAK